jgi:hypothetical protein
VSADNPLAIDPQLTDYLRQRLQAEAEAAERRRLDRIAAAVQRAWDRAADLTTSKRLRDVRRRCAAGEAPTEHTNALTRAVFARRVALLGRVLARTLGTDEGAAWWAGMARDPLERSLVACAMAGRSGPVRALLETVRGVQVTVYNDVRLWLGRCAEEVRRCRCPAAGGEGPGAVVETPPREAEPTEVQYVTLDQAAARVNRSKRTLEKRLKKMPDPDVVGTGGKPHEWLWSRLRPWLEKEFGKIIPERFPTLR